MNPREWSIALVCLVVIGTADACQICIPYPKKSAADFFIESDALVLAREDPDHPFHFRSTEVLKGTDASPIDLFVDSGTRRLLVTHPDRAIVLAGKTTGSKTSWNRIGVADEDTLPVIRAVLDASSGWKKDPEARIEFFAAYLDHGHPELREQAHLEVARAPYREIRKLRGALSREEIHRFLADTRYIEWHALYILLLAGSEHPADRDYIRKSFHSSARFGTTIRLAAWATASIELEKEAAVDFIESEYFGNPDRTHEELEAVHTSLSVHGTNGHTRLRDHIVAAYRTLLANHPAMTPAVASDLIAWKRTEFTAEIAAYAATHAKNLDFDTTLKLRGYARRSSAP